MLIRTVSHPFSSILNIFVHIINMEEWLVNDLRLLGLTHGEARAYCALLKLGVATKKDIVRESKLSSSIVYDVIERLIARGMATYTIVDGKRYFKPTSPRCILNMIEEERKKLSKKEEILSKIISFHEIMHTNFYNRDVRKTGIHAVEVFHGLKGLKSMLERIVSEEFETNRTKEWLAMGVTGTKDVKFNSMWMGWHSRIRPKFGVKARFIFCENDTPYVLRLSNTLMSEARVLRTERVICVTVCGPKTLLMKYAEPSIHVMIDDALIAHYFREIFERLWGISETFEASSTNPLS